MCLVHTAAAIWLVEKMDTLLELQHWHDGRRTLTIVHLDIDHHFCLKPIEHQFYYF
jgi:hypothetical protein